MKYLQNIAVIVLLIFTAFTITGLKADDRNNEEKAKVSNDYEKYGEQLVSMSLKNFENTSDDTQESFLGDCEPGGLANMCCPYWNVEVKITWVGPEVTCTTGGEFKCKDTCTDGSSTEPEVKG